MCLLLLNMHTSCNREKYIRFQPILEYYPNLANEDLYIILPPSTCYSCQSEFWSVSSSLLLNHMNVKCIFCTDKLGYEALDTKCVNSGLSNSNFKIDTMLFDRIVLPDSELGYPILLELSGNAIFRATICTNSEVLINRLKEINP